MRLLSSLGGALGVVLVVVVIVLVNGGYVYRTQCPHLQGSTETSWSYHINDIAPYVGYSRSGCQVHTATRLALDWVGVWKLHAATAPTANSAPGNSSATGHQSEYTASQRTFMQTHCVNSGKPESFCKCAMAELTRAFTPSELGQISAVTRYDELPSELASRAHDVNTAIASDCH
jgi:hypothetical protein